VCVSEIPTTDFFNTPYHIELCLFYLYKHLQKPQGAIVLAAIAEHIEVGQRLGRCENAAHVHKVFAVGKQL